MAEGENPTRRYKSFRPRQAAQGGASVFPITQAAVGLYNNSTGAYYLVVRAVRVACGDSPDTVTFVQQLGQIGGTTTPGIPCVGGDKTPPGLIVTADLAAFPSAPFGYTFDCAVAGADQFWEQPFPFAVIPPNWTLYGAIGNGPQSLAAAFVWEWVEADELDYFW